MARRAGCRGSLAAAIAVVALALTTPADAEARLGSLTDVFARLGSCWKPPPPRAGDQGMEMTVVLSFRRDGSLLGKPALAYESRSVSDAERSRYEIALAQTLRRCMPMPFTDDLAAAIAGRPLRIRFDVRRTRSTERIPWQTTKTL
jgi:hypothetical protein